NSMIEREMWEGWRDSPGVLAAEPLGHTMFTARTPDDIPLDDVVLWGVESGSFLEPKVISGEQLGGQEDGIVISAMLAEKHDVSLGDVLVLDRVLTRLTVVGITEEYNIGHVPIIYSPMRKWQEATYGPPGGPPPGEELPDILFDYSSVIALRLDPSVDIQEWDIEWGTVSLNKQIAYQASSGYKEEVQTVQMIQAFMVIISALVIGAFFTIWTIQRTQEIGLVKALGGSSSYLLRDTMAQAMIVTLFAVGLGTLSAVWLGFSLESSGSPFMMVRNDILGSSGLLIIAGLVGSMVSVRLITRIDPIIALGRSR
ncbi:MAG: ABC transporter permease, partial [Gammaproteobacteria bacterium]|nr:ABC transporter permease [Gammaproteobacteria bacterium]